jgi:hypothetical protein
MTSWLDFIDGITNPKVKEFLESFINKTFPTEGLVTEKSIVFLSQELRKLPGSSSTFTPTKGGTGWEPLGGRFPLNEAQARLKELQDAMSCERA